MSGPRPHVEPTRSRSVGIALQGPAVVHCNAWASSFRVASSGADMDPEYPSTDKAYTSKSHSLSTRLLVDAFFGSLNDFSAEPSNSECDNQVRSWCQHTWRI